MKYTYKIRAFIESDRKKIIQDFSLTKSPVQAQGLNDAWDWFYSQNPLLEHPEYGSYAKSLKNIVLECTETETGKQYPVGFVAMIPNLLQTNDTEAIGTWSVDMYVLPEHRGQSLRLVLALRKASPLGVILGVKGAALAVETKMGWEKVGASDPFVIRFPTVKMLRHLLGKSKVPPFLINASYPISRLIYKLTTKIIFKTPRIGNGIRIEKVERFGDEVDLLWNEIRKDFKILTKRDSAYLNWKFADNPMSTFDMFEFYENERIKGFLILKITNKEGFKWGQIIEFFSSPNDLGVINSMSAFTVNHFQSNNCDLATVIGLLQNHRESLKQHGFMKFKYDPNFIVKVDDKSRKDYFLDPDNWFISFGDSDGSK